MTHDDPGAADVATDSMAAENLVMLGEIAGMPPGFDLKRAESRATVIVVAQHPGLLSEEP
ncbi:MAG: hypothetical protein U9O18_07905 [Chloroflexota bacterium]|nr:hypothetical protein [Chloroflexota bacterium]